MFNTIVLISDISDLAVIPIEKLTSGDAKTFSFEYNAHIELQNKNIKHEIADDLIDQEKRFEIFDKMIEWRTWYTKINSGDYEIEGVNILKIFDVHEFQLYLSPILINLLIIKKIIENEKPTKIIATSLLSKTIQSIINNKNIKTEFFENNYYQNKLLWDNITIKYNIGRIPITFQLSRKNYQKIKIFLENITNFFYGLNFDLKSDKKNAIVFLEFNPEAFSKLFKVMSNYNGNIILVNQRRPAVWNKNSLAVIKNSKCKILKFENILNKEEKNKVELLINNQKKKLELLWENSKLLNEIFQIEGISFWNIIKDTMKKNYSERLSERIFLIHGIKKIFDSIDIRCIVSLNESGETEKTFLEFNNKQIPSILLEHGFIERIQKTKRFDVLSDYYSFKDKIAVWGEMKKEWLVNQYNIDPKRIIVTGSPRHDSYFLSRIEKKSEKEKILLLAPNPINDVNGLSTTTLKLKFNEVIKNILTIVKKFEDVKIIVKLHPIQLQHNDEIKSLIKKFDGAIPIYLWTSIIDTINGADAVVVVTPEINATPTILLESMILGKPTMNIYLDKKLPEYDHVKSKAVFTILDTDDLENNLKKILFDKEFQNELQVNADNFLKKFLANRGNASEKFASILQSY